METIITPPVMNTITEFVDISKKDTKAELECKLLQGKIETKDVADRILKAIQTLAVGVVTEEHRLTLSYPDRVRVNVETPQLVHKVCTQGSFKDVPLLVEIKKPYFEQGIGKKDTIDIPDLNTRFSLRSEKEVKRDWDGSPNDVKAHLRLIHRKSFKTVNDLFRIDFSMVKTREANSKQTLKDALAKQPRYELEIEFINKKTLIDNESITKEFVKIISSVLQAYYQTPFLLSNTDIQRYISEFKMTSNIFYDLVTLERRNLNPANPHNISKGYTVTIKADGDRCGLYVARDRRVLKVPKNPEQLVWTGITARDDSHLGDFIDGEFIPEKNLFCIFDVYRFRNRDTKKLPLMTTDDDVIKNPLNSRLGCAKLFVEDLKTQFIMSPNGPPMRIETKLFLAGDGQAMEESIKIVLGTQYEYHTDGLIFTPRASSVAPNEDRLGRKWLRVYKWKPPHQNSIDFLVKIAKDEVIDPKTGQAARKGELYVARSQDDNYVYPRERMNGEYVPKRLPEDLQKVADVNTRIPSLFQPSVPKDPNAYEIYIQTDSKKLPVDINGNRVEDNTVIECAFDMEKYRWEVMRTRYDKTYRYRVLKEPMFGNDISTADNVWTSIHVPITEEMVSNFVNNPINPTTEDDVYYRDDLKRNSRLYAEVYNFHNDIKEYMYKEYVRQGNLLLELGCGRGGDLYKWKRSKPAKVVALDYSLSNIESPIQGAAKRYLKEKIDHPHDYLPPVLFVVGDMNHYPLFEQEDKYMPILTGTETAPTEYLSQFEGLSKFDKISCQFALHYACESEETFHNFAKNIEKYGKEYFFGTCSDGQAIYSLLLGKKSHVFTADKQIMGEYSKMYSDRETWTEEFGMAVRVMLESFDAPQTEYLVPMQKVTEIMKEHGYELIDSKNFQELYAQQTNRTLTIEQQTFSFLNRTFVFKRMKGEAKAEAKAEVVLAKEEEKEEEEEKVVETTKKRKLKLEKEPEPILFHGSDESKGEYRNLSNMSNHPVEVDGVTYNTVEHYFQAMKAKEFKDEEAYNKIISAKTPKAAKAAGAKIKDFVEEVWDAKKDEIMKKGLRAKFVQHPELRKQLVATEDRPIGEADPRDVYWGIGTSMDLEKAKSPSKWRGQNKLGKMLMELRTVFNNESI